ncbi:hypothetical protein [Nocardia colli]|uniref:hypothetical protein n=1 Tax=Nocardia colli TaxID=2545717 RepID=UPI0035DAB041
MTTSSDGHKAAAVARRNAAKSPKALQVRGCEYTNTYRDRADHPLESHAASSGDHDQQSAGPPSEHPVLPASSGGQQPRSPAWQDFPTHANAELSAFVFLLTACEAVT